MRFRGAMNNHPPPRRSVNVGSILLTPQENECLFGYLGRKCAVSLVPTCRFCNMFSGD